MSTPWSRERHAQSSALGPPEVRGRRWAVAGALAAALLVGGAAVASAAASGRYRGRTSQQQTVRFKLSAKQVTAFHVVILERCPDGHTLRVSSTYPAMSVRNGKFGGSFVPRRSAPGERAQLHGRVGTTLVTGSLKDTSRSTRERALCHGSITFTARHA